jgi:hypothetical protein
MAKYVINQDLPIKYVLECHASVPSYPTKQDFMFDIISYLVRVSEAKSKDLDQGDVKFTTKTLKYIFGDKLQGEFLEKLKLVLEALVKEGTINKKGDSILIPESEFSKYYSLTN